MIFPDKSLILSYTFSDKSTMFSDKSTMFSDKSVIKSSTLIFFINHESFTSIISLLI